VAAGGSATRERSPPNITGAPREPAGRGCAQPGRVVRTARPQVQCGWYACSPRGHQGWVPVAFVSALPRQFQRGAVAPPPTWWCNTSDSVN